MDNNTNATSDTSTPASVNNNIDLNIDPQLTTPSNSSDLPPLTPSPSVDNVSTPPASVPTPTPTPTPVTPPATPQTPPSPLAEDPDQVTPSGL